MPGAVLNVHVTWAQRFFDAVIEFEDDFAGDDDRHVHSVGGVHTGLVQLVGFQYTWELLLKLTQSGFDVQPRVVDSAVGREGEQEEAVASDWRKERRLRPVGAGVREGSR